MSHHCAGPALGFPHGDARLNLSDLYAFPKPGAPDKSIFIIDAHPSVGLNPAGPTTSEPFAPNATYGLKIDTDDDTIADIAYRICFTSSSDGTQTAALHRAEGAEAAATGEGGQLIVAGAPVSMTALTANGFRWTEPRCLRRVSSSWAMSKLRTSRASPRTMLSSYPSSRTRSNTRAGTRSMMQRG